MTDGFASVLLGVTLDARGWSTTKVGVLLTAILAGIGLLSLVVGRYAELVGRRLRPVYEACNAALAPQTFADALPRTSLVWAAA